MFHSRFICYYPNKRYGMSWYYLRSTLIKINIPWHKYIYASYNKNNNNKNNFDWIVKILVPKHD